jgi:hypothetical protein
MTKRKSIVSPEITEEIAEALAEPGEAPAPANHIDQESITDILARREEAEAALARRAAENRRLAAEIREQAATQYDASVAAATAAWNAALALADAEREAVDREADRLEAEADVIAAPTRAAKSPRAPTRAAKSPRAPTRAAKAPQATTDCVVAAVAAGADRRAEVVRRTGLTATQVTRALAAGVRAGLLSRSGTKRGTTYGIDAVRGTK